MTIKRHLSPTEICAALFVVLVASGGQSMMAPETAARAPVYAVSEADTGPRPDASFHQKEPSRRPHKMDWGRDPFQDPRETVASLHGRPSNGGRLVGIISGSKGRMAIFGHSILQKGDMVGNETIVDIDRNRVTVTRDGFKRIIAMQEVR